MTDLLPVTILVTTYFPAGQEGQIRRLVAEETLLSWEKFMIYSGELRLMIIDDASVDTSFFPNDSWHIHRRFASSHRLGVGHSLNCGILDAYHERSLIVLYAADDWALTEPFHIDPWVQLLVERKDVGMVRLGLPHPGTSGSIEAFTSNWQGWGLRLDRKGFAFGHRPALYHKRFFDTYGFFDENCSALECERLYNERFVRLVGPDIVLALPHPWRHLDSVELGDIDPKEEK